MIEHEENYSSSKILVYVNLSVSLQKEMNRGNSESMPLQLKMSISVDGCARYGLQSKFENFLKLKNKYWSAENRKKLPANGVKPSLT